MLPLSHLDQLLAEGRLKEAAALLDAVPSLSRALQIVRLRIETQIGNPQAARTKAAELLSAHLTSAERITCLDIVGRVLTSHGDVSNGVRHLRMALELASVVGDKVIQARQHASLADALLHWVGIEPAYCELPALRKLTLRAGDPVASIEFHLIGAEVAIKRREDSRLSAHLQTAEGMLTRYPNLVQLARLKNLQSVLATLMLSPFAALAFSEEAHGFSVRAGSISTIIPVLANTANICLRIGRLLDCEKHLAFVEPYIRRGGAVEIGIRNIELELALARGENGRADSLVESLRALSERHDDGRSYYGLWHALTRTSWLFRPNRALEGTQQAIDTVPVATQMGDRHLLQRMRFLAAEGLALTDRPRDAAALLAEGVLDDPDPPPEVLAEASRVAGTIAAAADLPAAVAHFERAARIYASIGSSTARGETIVAAGDAFATADGMAAGDSWKDLPELYRLPRQTSIRLDTADPIVADSRDLGARVIEGVGAAIALAAHPALVGHELMQIIHDAGAADVAALIERRGEEPPEVLVWTGCDLARARTLPDEAAVVRIPLGTGHGRTCEIVAALPSAPAARVTLLAVERLAQASIELHAARDRERERGALWPEQTPEQQLGMIFASESMVELVKTMHRVAASNVPVLITGETGTGKELLARALHQSSTRRDQPFVPFNCTAVPREMIDAQLFGYRRGAFTGAHESFPGVIRAATGGTVFLDEIGEIGVDVQPKLLRFLESGEVHPLGEVRPTTADVRILAATNANLERLVAEGRFREDLFYRLDVIRLRIPPLRERLEEIPLLVDHFLLQFSQDARKTGLRVAEETMEYLVLYRWPGNVRQLANEMHRLVTLAESGAVLMPEHLSAEIAATRRTVPASQRDLAPTELVVRLDQPLSAAMEHLELAMLQHAMRRSEGRVDEAARMLGVSRKGLYLKRHRFGLA